MDKNYKGMTRALVNEINTFIEVYSDEKYNKDEITNLFSVYQDLNIDMFKMTHSIIVMMKGGLVQLIEH